MAILLSFDTATRHCAVVLGEGARVLASRHTEADRYSHAEVLNVYIDEVMREAGLPLDRIDAVAAGIGPGSYTGLRIGLSAAKGLCFGLERPLIALATHEVLLNELRASHAADGAPALVPMIDARRMEVFLRHYDAAGTALDRSAAVVLDAAWCAAQEPGSLVFGDGADKAVDLWSRQARVRHVAGVRPSVQGLAITANARFLAGAFADTAYLVPDYGKPANITTPGAR